MQSIPDDVRRNLAARSNRALWGFLALGLILAVPTLGFGLFLAVWALIQRAMAQWLINHGRLVPATLKGMSSHAGENWTTENAYLSTMIRRGPYRAFNAFMLLTARIIPIVLVASEFEIDGRSKSISKYMFSNERISVDERGYARMLVNPRFPRMHGWLVSHIPEHDRSILASDLIGETPIQSDDEDRNYRDAA